MDLASMMKTMLSPDSIAQMSEKTGASTDEVKSVLLSALPAMLSGAKGQANGKDTVAGFAGALESHAKDDTSDVSAFLSHVDIKDGEKIVGHLLGGDKDAATKAAAERAGLSTKATGSILGAAAPLLMSLLGQQVTQAVQAQAQPQAQAQNVLPLGNAQQAVPSGAGLLASLLGGGQAQAPSQAQQPGLGGLLGSLMDGAQPQSGESAPSGGGQAQSAAGNPLGSLVGSLLGGSGGDVSSLLSVFLGSGK